MASLNNLFELSHVGSSEGYRSAYHGVEKDAHTPYIRLETFVAIRTENLRSYVSRCPTLLYYRLVMVLNYTTDAKITKLDVTLCVDEDVVELYVSVKH